MKSLTSLRRHSVHGLMIAMAFIPVLWFVNLRQSFGRQALPGDSFAAYILRRAEQAPSYHLDSTPEISKPYVDKIHYPLFEICIPNVIDWNDVDKPGMGDFKTVVVAFINELPYAKRYQIKEDAFLMFTANPGRYGKGKKSRGELIFVLHKDRCPANSGQLPLDYRPCYFNVKECNQGYSAPADNR